jgi:ribosomal-protein-alanine N-acetyltransferase
LSEHLQQKVTIRHAGQGDLPAIEKIERVSFSTPWTESMYAAELIRTVTVFLAAEEAGVVVGYVCAWAVVDKGHILKIAVAPDRSRQGIGGLLMAELTKKFLSRGVDKMWLEVRQNNSAALSFYQGLGFSEVALHKKYYSDTGEDAIVMARRINY